MVFARLSAVAFALVFVNGCGGRSNSDGSAGSGGAGGSGGTSIAPFCSPGEWCTLNSSGFQKPRYSHSAVQMPGKVIVWGGMDGDPDYRINTGWVIEFGGVGPTSQSGAPSPREEHHAFSDGTRMYVWGGGDAMQAFADGGIYGPESDSWSPISTANAPDACYDNAATTVGSRWVIWGGRTPAGQIPTGAIYDPSNDTWEPVSKDGAIGHWQLALVGFDQQFWAIGGNSVESGQAIANVSAYNVVTKSWSARPDLPEPAGSVLAAWLPVVQRVVVWLPFEARGYSIAPEANTWVPLGTANAPNKNGGAESVVLADGRWLIFGGSHYDGPSLVPALGAIYDPVQDSWTELPIKAAPQAVQGFTLTALNGGEQVLVWGGFSAGGKLFNERGWVFAP